MSNSASGSNPATPLLPSGATSIITALGQAYKSQTGDPIAAERIAQLLIQNMPQLSELAKQGKLNSAQILQVCAIAFKWPTCIDGETRAVSCSLCS